MSISDITILSNKSDTYNKVNIIENINYWIIFTISTVASLFIDSFV